MQGLGAHCRDFARSVRAFQRGQIHHGDRGVNCPHLGLFFNRPCSQRRRPGLSTYLVNTGKPGKERVQPLMACGGLRFVRLLCGGLVS